jgi:hypothetical protein
MPLERVVVNASAMMAWFKNVLGTGDDLKDF